VIGYDLSMRVLRRFQFGTLVIVYSVAFCTALISAQSSHADAIAVPEAMTATTVMEIFVEEDEVRVELEASVPDLVAFDSIFPDRFRVRMGQQSEPEEVLIERFFTEEFVIRADGGPPLRGRLVSFETGRRVPRDEITGEPVPVAEGVGTPVVIVVFSCPLDGRPKTLSFKPPMKESGVPAATIGFVAYHSGMPVTDFRGLGAEEILDLDWSDPWFSKFRNRNLWRQNDSPLNVFLYVEPYEVRVEIIARPADIQAWTDLGIEGLRSFPVELQNEIMERVGEFFSAHLDLAIDGAPVTPDLDRIGFLNRTLWTPTVVTPPRELDAFAATLGVIFIQPRTGYPREAAVTWTLFPDRVERISGAAIDEAGSLRVFLQRDDNVLRWKNVLKDPTLPTLVDVRTPPSIVVRGAMWLCWLGLAVAAPLLIRAFSRAMGGAASWAAAGVLALVVAALATGGWNAAQSVRLDADRASEIVSALLNNIYRAFDSRDEEVVYESLARSVTDDLLGKTHLEIRRGLELAGEGGARARVQEIELTGLGMMDSDDGLRMRCQWNVAAAVAHWGHIHQRVNRYVADLHLEAVDGVWKITGMELIEEQRL
jgi:hypothetical protein